MKKIKVLGLSLLALFVLGACSSGEKDVKVSDSSGSKQETKESKSTEKKESAVGKRSNPVPLGKEATFDTKYYDDNSETIDANLSITISNVIRGEEAYNLLMENNEFNEPAPDGQEWIVFDVSEKLNKGSEDDPYYEMGFFKVISASGSEVSQTEYGTLNESFGDADLYPGGTLAGKEVVHAPVGEDILLEYTGNDLDTSVFFSLQ